MSFITWTLDLDTGFADIDDQHKVLVDKINKFYDVYQTGNVVDIKIALQELLDYTVFHFDHEEKCWKKPITACWNHTKKYISTLFPKSKIAKPALKTAIWKPAKS